MSKQVFLNIKNDCYVDRIAWTITQGIPFANRVLRRDSNIRITDIEGNILPAQWRCLATWSKDNIYVKWLLVDFLLDIKAFEQKTVVLEYDTDINPFLDLNNTNANRNNINTNHSNINTNHSNINTNHNIFNANRNNTNCNSNNNNGNDNNKEIIQVKKQGNKTCIDTGIMQVDIRHNIADFFASCRINNGDGWKNILSENKALFLYMKDQYGTWYDSYLPAPAPVIEFEEIGPIRTSLCIRGVLASKDGRPFCPYTLRLHFFAGKAVIKVDHTFIFNQNPEKIELTEAGIKLSSSLGENQQFTIGGECENYYTNKHTTASILQITDDLYEVKLGEIMPGKGVKTSGWCSQSSEKGSITAVLYNMWQEYPKGFVIDKTGIDIQIWPGSYSENYENLRFSTPYKEEALRFNNEILKNRDEEEFKRILLENPTAPLNLKSLIAVTKEEIIWVEKMLDKYAPDRPASYNDTGTENGYGAAKTTEIFLKFDNNEVSDDSKEKFALCVQNPLMAVSDIEYMCSTGALRYISPPCPEHFPRAEKMLEKLFNDVIDEPRKKLKNYGMFNYGDLICSHSPTPSAIWNIFKNEENIYGLMKHCSKAYNNESNDQLYALWGFFTHTGNIEYYRAAEAYGKHMADVDFYHEGPNRGLIHYHNAHHWSGGGAPCHSAISGLMLQYYITGNQRIFEVCKENVQWILDRQEPCGIIKGRNCSLVREYTTPIANLLEMYQATWEYKYGALAYRSLKWMLNAFREPGCFPLAIRTGGIRGDEAFIKQNRWCLRQAGGMTPQMFYDAVEIFKETGDDIFEKSLLGMAHRYLFGPESEEWSPMFIGPKKIKRTDPFFNVSLIAYAYKLTEDPIYAAYCSYYLSEWFPWFAEDIITQTKLRRPGHFTSVCWGSLIPPLIRAVKDAYKKYGEDNIKKEKEKYVDYVTREFKPAVGVDNVDVAGDNNDNVFKSVGIISGYNDHML